MDFEAFLGVNPWTALFTLLNFLLVLFVGKHYLYGPVLKLIRERQEEIDGMYDKADKAQKDAEALRAQYTEKLSQAQAESERLVKDATVRARGREEEIVRQANEEAAAIQRKASAQIAQEKKKALNEAKDEISGLAVDIAEKVVERELTDTDRTALFDSFLQKLEDVQ